MTYKADPAGYRAWVVFGSAEAIRDCRKDDIREMPHEVVFKTQEELDAYLMALDDMDGWSDYRAMDTLDEALDRVIEALGETPEGYAKCRCQNCGKLWREKDLINPIPDLHERVDPGEKMPNGECPGCGAVAHEEETDEECEPAPAKEGERRSACSGG